MEVLIGTRGRFACQCRVACCPTDALVPLLLALSVDFYASTRGHKHESVSVGSFCSGFLVCGGCTPMAKKVEVNKGLATSSGCEFGLDQGIEYLDQKITLPTPDHADM